MKKSTPKLSLRPQTLRVLTADDCRRAAGGILMKDTIIIRTGGIIEVPAPDGRQG